MKKLFLIIFIIIASPVIGQEFVDPVVDPLEELSVAENFEVQSMANVEVKRTRKISTIIWT